jgi:hypothetical protein
MFACDSVIDSSGKVYLLECNGQPAAIQNDRAEPAGTIWHNLAGLFLNFWLAPTRLLKQDEPCPFDQCSGVWAKNSGLPPFTSLSPLEFSMGINNKKQYTYGGWRLIFNEMEMSMDDYDVCRVVS